MSTRFTHNGQSSLFQHFRDLLNANVTFDDISVVVKHSKLDNNTGLVDKMCNHLHTAFKRNQIAVEINSDRSRAYYEVFLQDSAVVLKLNWGRLIRNVLPIVLN